MAAIIPTLIVILVMAFIIAGYIWYLKRNGYIGPIDEAVVEKESNKYKLQQKRAEQFCEWYLKNYTNEQ